MLCMKNAGCSSPLPCTRFRESSLAPCKYGQSRHKFGQPGWSRANGLRVQAYAELTAKGKQVSPDALVLGSQLGSGSFGEVFKGTYITEKGAQAVVLKRVKTKVEGAKEMGEMELLLNAYAAKVARNHCAHFLGHCYVDDSSNTRLTPGLWLMWRYEGSRTLAHYLRRRDTLKALAADMEVPLEAVPAVVMKQLLQGLMAFHAAGLVHRDVKPLNIILAEDTKRLKFIDLGACADLRSGTNYVPDESILDLNYCPPEQYVLPTDSPHLSKNALRLAISPMLWAQCKPDRFDSWSAGITFMQLCVPYLRTERGLKNFNNTYGPKYDYDLDAWRKGSYLPAKEFEVLDADQQAGWNLARALLRPRSIKTMPDGVVMFVNDSSVQRISAGEALKHRFMRQARFGNALQSTDGSPSGSSSDRSSANKSLGGNAGKSPPKSYQQQLQMQEAKYGSRPGSNGQQQGRGLQQQQQKQPEKSTRASTFGAAVGLWRNLSNRLFDLEAGILTAASATQQQTTTVRKLQQKVGQAKGDKQELQDEQRKLSKLELQLSGLQEDFSKTSAAVTNVLSFMGLGNNRRREEEEVQQKLLSSGASSSSGKAQGVGQQDSGKAMWRELQQKLASLEILRNKQVSATEKQTQTVRLLREQVPPGEEPPHALRKAEAALKKMEQRAAELNQAVRATQEQTQNMMARFGLASPTGSSQREHEQLQQQQQAEQQQAEQQRQKEAAEKQLQAQKSASGFLSRMFGFGGGDKSSQGGAVASSALQQQQQQQQEEQQRAEQATAQEEQEQQQQLQGELRERQGLEQSISQGANVFLTNSLRFTGMAARVALGMATDATKAIKRMEADSELKRKARDASQTFRRMLASKQPPMTPNTPYTEVVEAFGQDPRYLAVPEEERQSIVASYLDSLVTAQMKAQETAQQRLRDLYITFASPTSRYEDIAPQVAENPVVQAVQDEALRASLFLEAVQSLRAEQKGREDVAYAEERFTAMLVNLSDPPILPSSSWPLVKPQIWKDPRYIAVPEARRREIFSEVHAQVVAEAQAAATEEQERMAAQADKLAIALESVQGESVLIAELRREQARLRAEYDRMEGKLREMEEQMKAREAEAARAQGESPVGDEGLEPEMPSGTIRLRSSGTAKVGKSKSSKVDGSRKDSKPETSRSNSAKGSNNGRASSTHGSNAQTSNGSSAHKAEGDENGSRSAVGSRKKGRERKTGGGVTGGNGGEDLVQSAVGGEAEVLDVLEQQKQLDREQAQGQQRQESQQQQQQQQPHNDQGENQGTVGGQGKGWFGWLKGSPDKWEKGKQPMQQGARGALESMGVAAGRLEAAGSGTKGQQQQLHEEPWGLEASVPQAQGGTMPEEVRKQQVEDEGSNGEESSAEEDWVQGQQGSDSEQALAESLMALGVRHRMLPDGTIEFSFDSTPSNSTLTKVSDTKRKFNMH